jgi:hypothetical protein
VKFTVLAARIDAGRQIVEQRGVELPPGKPAIELFRIDAGDARAKPPAIMSRASAGVPRSFSWNSGNSGVRSVPARRSSRYRRMSGKNRSPNAMCVKPSATARRTASVIARS